MKLTSFDLFRKLPEELTLGTKLGGVLSIFLFLLLSILTLSELYSFSDSTIHTQLELDPISTTPLFLLFSFSFPNLNCNTFQIQYSHSTSTLSSNPTELQPSDLIKTAITPSDSTSSSLSYSKTYQFDGNGRIAVPPKHHNSGLFSNARMNSQQNEENARFGKVISEDSIQALNQALESEPYTIVLFYAPWCPYCRSMMPEWSLFVAKDGPSAGFSAIGIDCTKYPNVCTESHVMGIPSIRAYARDKALEPFFSGRRNAQAILNFAINMKSRFEQSNNTLERLPADSTSNVGVSMEGCKVAGRVQIENAPGLIQFTLNPNANSQSMRSDHANFTHVINALQLVKQDSPPSLIKDEMKHDRRKKNFEKVVERMVGAEFVEGLDGSLFKTVMNQHGLSFDHHIKFVPIFYQHRFSQPYSNGYQMTVGTHAYYKVHGSAEVRLNFDISPLRLKIQVKSAKQWYEFVTKLSAILGGMFSVFKFADKSMYAYFKMQNKQRQGKLT